MADLANFGDSVHWGQGHKPESKFAKAVAHQRGLNLQMNAHSGATIGANAECTGSAPGEVPYACPTIIQQVQRYAPDPGNCDLVLLNGGINDLTVQLLINPLTTEADVKRKTREYCHRDMTQLLRVVLEKFSKAETRVIVTSYFPIFSALSLTDPKGMEAFLAAHMIFIPPQPTAVRGAILDRVVKNAQAFWTESTASLHDAIRDVASSRIHFAFVPYTDRNAMFAPEPWLFGVKFTPPFTFEAEDPIAEQRKRECDDFHTSPFDRLACHIASAGHPNSPGAQAFTEAILAVAIR